MTQQNGEIPTFQHYMNPIIEALLGHDEPMSKEDLDAAAAKKMGLTPHVLALRHDPEKGDGSEVSYRMAWARTYLKKMGLLVNPKRGVWQLTDRGRELGRVDPSEVVRQVRAGADAEVIAPELPDYLVEELIGLHGTLESRGQLLVHDKLEACYLRFREKFGPDVLRGLDGEQLLNAIHGRGTKDSLVYWLEFKDDDEFPSTSHFGSIAGGSALKFGIYQSTQTGDWMTGNPRSQTRLSIRKAVELVRGQRDQLVAGTEILAEFADAPESPDYEILQKRMEEAAPDLAESAWGHKYFSLLFPNLLDDYHALDYQKYHLVKLLKLPSEGRYKNARFFIAIAHQLQIPVTELGTVLNLRDGNPHQYWRIGTSPDEDGRETDWPRMRDGGFAAIGWSEIGSLDGIEQSKAGRDQVRALVDQHFAGKRSVVSRAANQLYNFATAVEPRDIVVAMQGARVLAIGEIAGDYYYEPGDGPFAHRRAVRWRVDEEWRLPHSEGLRTTFVKLGKHARNLIEIEARLSAPEIPPPVPHPPVGPIEGLLARIQAALQRKGQVILYGPPGTGKTYWAERAIQELASRSWFKRSYDSLAQEDRAALVENGAIAQCCFHPAYGYEDFLIGYRPVVENGSLAFEPRKGIFADLCERAKADPSHQYFLLIDEINRGDIPRIFGELLTVLEKDKRGKPILLPLTGEEFIVPANVFVIGTMNTADRSIALLDAALRRRFAFVELLPDASILKAATVGGIPLGPWLQELNRRVVRFAGRGSRNLQIGHSYLMRGGAPIQDKGRFAEVLRDDIIPLLQEYCYEDFEALERILGDTIVLREQQRIDESLFEPNRLADLLEALLSAFEVITATPAAVDAEAEAEEEASDEEDLSEDDDEGDAA
jgi:5-methylcytosine-specific restriction protein B